MSEILEDIGIDSIHEEKIEEFSEPENSVIHILGKLHNPDLEATLMGITKNHFKNLPESEYTADKLRIPNFTQKLWDGYNSYLNSTFVASETAALFRTEIIPEIVDVLTGFIIKQKVNE